MELIFHPWVQSFACMLTPQLLSRGPEVDLVNLCKSGTKAVLKTDRNAQFEVKHHNAVSIKTLQSRGAGYAGYLPVITGWFMVLHSQERILVQSVVF